MSVVAGRLLLLLLFCFLFAANGERPVLKRFGPFLPPPPPPPPPPCSSSSVCMKQRLLLLDSMRFKHTWAGFGFGVKYLGFLHLDRRFAFAFT
ncbi:hypothetical protein MUK42_31348 [Musa troglodytarum]|uniref:Secreted protein n=1 Tax=Musa troglodytarum TaxID=320322 RepID=A0A9E7JWZ1_9LILI|nr:hypothetical protein MUK42_31348 [Musa troglodytarum]